MKKKLFQSEKEFLDFVYSLLDWDHPAFPAFRCCEKVEEYFGVYFGTEEEREEGDDSRETWKIDLEENRVPEQYPCVMSFWFERDDFDRRGTSTILATSYTYLSDFGKESLDEDQREDHS